ncbi:MAG: archaetidylserine decarboxylase [Pseudomonadales bacterium]
MMAQYLLPHHLLSRLAGCVAECRWPWFKNPLIEWFVKSYQVNMSEAEITDPTAFAHFNDFFTRALKADARIFVDAPGSIACPVDGAISQIGDIDAGRIFQAKGHEFSTYDLLGGSLALEKEFDGGKFTTVYLSPKDYHRIHMPVSGILRKMIYVPGRLFSVSPLTTSKVPSLFSRNERMVAIFDTEFGPMAMVLVGAMIVASIETVWAGLVTPPKRRLQKFSYGEEIHLKKGEELGRFKLGSTIVMLFGKDVMDWEQALTPDQSVQMGQLMGNKTS